jgi:hypothetical protein
MSEQGKRYAKVGDLVIHKRSGEMGRVASVHAPNEYVMGTGERAAPVSCPVAVLDSGTPFLDVPEKTMFDFLPDVAEIFRVGVQGRIEDAMSRILRDAEDIGISERDAMLIMGSVIRERMRKEG